MNDLRQAQAQFDEWVNNTPRSIVQGIIAKFNRQRLLNPGREKRKRLKHSLVIKLYAKQNGRCNECQEPYPMNVLEEDHIDPNRQDFNSPSNWQLLCHGCHKEKGAKTPIEMSKQTGRTVTDQVSGSLDDEL